MNDSALALLTAAEEAALGRAMRGGSPAARHELIRRNVRLVGAIARRFTGRGLELEELVQEGTIGLAEAADRWDPERGLRFSTYAVYWVRQRIGRAVQCTGELIRRPVHVHERWARVERRRRQLAHALGREPTTAELAAAVGLAVEALQALGPVPVVSLDAPGAPLGAPIEGQELRRQTPAPDRVEEEAVARLAGAARLALLRRRLLALLSRRDQQVLLRRFGGETLQAIGTELGLSREAVRQIQERALARLRQAAAGLTPEEREVLEG